MPERHVDWLDLLACQTAVSQINESRGLGADEALVATAASMLAGDLPAGPDVELSARTVETALRFLRIVTA